MQAKKAQSASNKPTQSPKQPEEVVPVEEITPDAMDVAVIKELVQAGIPYAEAKAQVMGGAQAAPAVEDEPDRPPPVAPAKSKQYSNEQIKLWEQYQNVDAQDSYEVTFNIPSYLYSWVVRATLQNAHDRNDPKFVVSNFLIMLLKEQRAIDPTKGGTIQAVSSGPKDTYNPVTGSWG